MDSTLGLHGDFSTEVTPLVEQKPVLHERQGEVGPSIFNLLNSAIGAGILSIPLAFYYSGIVLGSFLVLFLAFVCQYTLLVITQTAELYPGANSYEKIVSSIFGRKIGGVITGCIILSCFGTCAGFLIIIGELLTDIFRSIAPNASILHSAPFIIFIVSIIFILPLASLKTFNSMRFSSIVAICSILFVVVVIVIRSAQHIHEVGSSEARSAVKSANWSSSIFSALPLICFALTCHLQVVPIHSEMREWKNMKKVKTMVGGAEAICFVLYTITGIFGYLLFNTNCDVSDNVLKDFSTSDNLATVAKAVLSFIIVCHYPSAGFVLRKAVDNVIFKGSDDPLWRRVALSLCCWGLAFLLATFLPFISLVFGILGSTVSSLISFFFPSIFLWKHRTHPNWRGEKGRRAQVIAILICLLSLIMFFASTTTTIVDFIEKQHASNNCTSSSSSDH